MKLILCTISLIIMMATIAAAEMHCQSIFKGSTLVDCNEGIILTFKQFVPVDCPKPYLGVVNNSDGTYTKYEMKAMPAGACFEITKHKELWSNYPENKGTFIRRVE